MIRKTLNLLGLLLLALAGIAATARVWRTSATENNPNLITIRLSHWQLESGLREAYEEVARAYSQLHPNVRIVQLAVPGRFYGTYIRTQLTSDDPPDLMQLGGMPDSTLADHFTPLTRWVDKPNPYNAGTDLASTPWRDTFLGGLARSPGVETMLEYYGIPSTEVTVRMYANRDLYRKIMGHNNPPKNFQEFLAVCEKTNAYAAHNNLTLHPVAGSRFNANILLDRLFRSQTQKLALQRDPLNSLTTPSLLAFAGNQTNLDDPSIRNGLALMREVALQMSPGFLQFDRDDAIFHFGQSRALMIATGSWDYGSIASQSPFPVDVFDIPVPTPDDPRFGSTTLGPTVESGVGSPSGICVSNRSSHRDVAIDFLQFLTSTKGNQIFVNRAKWLPSIRGVKVPPEVEAFTARSSGYPDGFAIAPIMWGAGELYRAQSNNLHLLFDRDGSVDKFLAAMQPQMAAAVQADLRRQIAGYRESLARFNAEEAALLHLPETEDRLSQLREIQTSQEVLWLWLQRDLRTPATQSSGGAR